MRRTWLPVLALALGCVDTTFTAEAYDQSCERDGECVAVFVGDVCGCSCERVAINYDEIYLAEAERAELMESCAEVLSCAPCPDVALACDGAVCAILE